MKRTWTVSCFLILGSSLRLFAEGPDPIQQLQKRVVEHTLKNGLKVLVLERRTAPIVSFQMMFRVGGVDEISGKTGLAHLFEHIMFKGSRTVGTKNYEKEKLILDQINRLGAEMTAETSKGAQTDREKLERLKTKMEALEKKHQEFLIPAEFEQIYQRAGGQGLNAFTSQDMTGFVISLPSNKWELWPMMESDRMAYPVLRDFYKEREVVMEERRMRYENVPDGKLWENFIASAYMAHPYNRPTIGWSSDIRRLTTEDAEAFFKTHYAPNNAVVAIVGDVQAQEVIAKLEHYFSKVPSQTVPSDPSTIEPPQNGEKRITVLFDSEPSLLMGFHKPNPPDLDNLIMEVIEKLLGRGRTSRFNRNILDKKIAVSVWATNGNPGERYPNLMIFGGEPRKPYTNADLEKAIWGELEKLKKEKVPEKEIQKIQNQIRADIIRKLDSNTGMASELAYDQAVLGDWQYLFAYLDGIGRITPEQIQKTAQEYFKKSNVTVAFLERQP
jgi:predicted Zn-dependent peptidase